MNLDTAMPTDVRPANPLVGATLAELNPAVHRAIADELALRFQPYPSLMEAAL